MAKRLLDIVGATSAILTLWPIMFLSFMAIRLSMGSPTIFRQVRAGWKGADLHLFKFRSMREALGANGAPLPDEERVTPIGRFLRRTRLDELPELLLVLSGSMSFVGPRPLPRQTLEDAGILASRCRTRPGLTGLAQVSGNTLLSNEEKFAVDIWYNDHGNVVLDVGILVKTLYTVIFGEHRNETLIRKAMNHAYGPDRRR